LPSVTDDQPDLATLVREERDVREISQLKYRYLRTLDTKDWDGFEQCFVPEATGDYNGLVFDDRSALVGYMRANLGEGLVTLHQAHHPEIEVDFEATYNLGDLPGFQLKGPGEHTHR
jgi:hypothetical protein